MRPLRVLVTRLADLFQRRKREQDLADEIEANLQMHVEENIRAGMPPDEARRIARIRFGSVEAVKETVRDRRRIPLIETVARDIGYASRMLRQNKAWSVVAIVILAVGVGANSAVFAFVNDYAFKKLPVTNPDELVVFRWYGENTAKSLYSDDLYISRSTDQAGAAFSFDAFQQFRAHGQELLDIFTFASSGNLSVFVNGEAEYATGQFVSGNYYSALGVPAELGRMLNAQDDVEGAEPAVVISYQYWERRFAKDPRAVGAAISINNVAFAITGVTPSRFVDVTKRGSMNAPDITIPLALEPRVQPRGGSWLKYPQNWWLVVMGRLKPNFDRQQAEARLRPVFDQSARDGWTAFVSTMNAEQRAMPELGGRQIRVPRLGIAPAAHGASDAHESVLAYLGIFTAIFVIVLIIVCVNVSNLLLSRAAARQKEIAIRMGIGASRFRVIRQLLTDRSGTSNPPIPSGARPTDLIHFPKPTKETVCPQNQVNRSIRQSSKLSSARW